MDTLKIQIKELINKKWDHIPIHKLKGFSVLSYVASNDLSTVAAIYDEDKPVMFISNSMEEVAKYKSKGASFFALDLQDLISATVIQTETVTAMNKLFGECSCVELTLNPKEEKVTKNQIYKPNVSKLTYKLSNTRSIKIPAAIQQDIYMEDT